jgi:transposase
MSVTHYIGFDVHKKSVSYCVKDAAGALKPFAAELQMGDPAMMKAIGASKKKNDIDARKTADLVRCNLLPACYVGPVEIRELRRVLRYRNLVVAQATCMKNKMSGLLMEVGAEYNKEQLHGKKYFAELLGNLEEVPEPLSVRECMQANRKPSASTILLSRSQARSTRRCTPMGYNCWSPYRVAPPCCVDFGS